MAINLYFSTNTFTPYSAGPVNTWDNTSSYINGYLAPAGNAYLGNPGLATTTKTIATAQTVLFGIFTSPPMDSSVTSITMDNTFNCNMVVRAAESGANANAFTLWTVGITSEDGLTLRWYTSLMKDNSEVPTSLAAIASRNNGSGYTNTPASYTCQEGDRIFVEIGMDKDGASSFDIAMSLGYNSGGVDLSTTDGDTGADNPYATVEYSFAFKAESTPATGIPNQMMMTGCGI